jgi:hypothetical protein
MKLGELEEIFECDPEGAPINPQWIETEPEPTREPVKVGNS